MSAANSIEHHLTGLIEAIAKKVAAEMVPRHESVAPAFVRALPRKQACVAMGIKKSKLADLITEGVIKTVENDPRLIPVSEIERYCAPTQTKRRPRRAAKFVPPRDNRQDAEAIRAANRDWGRAK